MTSRTKAIALFMSADENSAVSDQHKQDLCRDFAERHHLAIMGFLAIAHDAARGVSYVIDHCLQAGADAIIIDEPETVVLALKDMHKLFRDLMHEHLELGFISHDL